jgi:DNA-directed RNA polymerase subunit RPC12/RpoP
VTAYRCSGCGAEQTAINDLAGMAHTRTAGKPSRCSGRWRPVVEAGSLPAPWRATMAALDTRRRLESEGS